MLVYAALKNSQVQRKKALDESSLETLTVAVAEAAEGGTGSYKPVRDYE